jgi:hypothetical protein
MKKRTGAILAATTFVVGVVTGYLVSSYSCSRVAGEVAVSNYLNDVSSAYFPLKLIKDGQTDRASDYLRFQLRVALQCVDAISIGLHRPDMKTNSVVVHARAFDRGLNNSN